MSHETDEAPHPYDEPSGDDRFNFIHQYEAGFPRHYACDIDLALVEKHPEIHIPAFIEFKQMTESIRYTQAVLFEQLRDVAPVYIIISEQNILQTPPDRHRFTIKEFIGINDISPTPPDVELELKHESVPWGGEVTYQSSFDWDENGGDGLIGWEDNLRDQRVDGEREDADDSTDNDIRSVYDYISGYAEKLDN